MNGIVAETGMHGKGLLDNARQRTLARCAGMVFVLIVAAQSSFALDPHKSISQYGHSNWQTEEGLPQIAVQSIAQTRDGYLWLGTQEGVVRFDGVKFTVFDRTNTPGLMHNSIQALIQTADGTLWIGTEGGLTCMRNGKLSTFTNVAGLGNDNVAAFFEDGEKTLWIATNGGGVSIWRNGSLSSLSVKDGLPNDYVTSVAGGKDGTIYFGTLGGLAKLSHGRFTVYTTADGLANNNVRSVHIDSESTVWAGTASGLSRFKNGRWTTFTTKDGLLNNRVRSLCRDRDGNLWVGTNGGGLSRMTAGRFTSYSTSDGLIDGFVSALCEDREGNLWVGTVGGGLNRFRDVSFTVFGEKEGLAQDNSRAIFGASDGSVWVGSDGHGLTQFKNGTLKTFQHPGALGYGARGICESPDGSLWIGTYGGGLCRLKDGKWTSYTTKDGLAHNTIFSLFESKDRTLWIGTRGGGVSSFRNGKFTNYTVKDGLASDMVRSILEAGDGSMWFCTTEGLNRLQDGKLTKYTTADGLSYKIVYSIFEDEQRALWIGTYGGGLNRFKNGRFTVITTKQGLSDNSVFEIIEDTHKNLWLTCNRGVYRVSEQELNDYADGKISAVHSTMFGINDGMRTAKCNGSSQPAGMRMRDGKLWIPTLKGVAIIDPDRIHRNNLPPPVYIERAVVDGVGCSPDSNLYVASGSSGLEIHYTALSYSAPGGVNFKYMLAGYDHDWIDAGNRRMAYYRNLSPGNYTFRVVACNDTGVWNWNAATLGLEIGARFYQTKWFLGLALLVVVLGGFAAFRVRIWQLLKREKILKARVDEAVAQIKVLDGLIPICAKCKKIRDDKGYWNQLEQYINEHSEATFSHGICPDCQKELYGDFLEKMRSRRAEPPQPSPAQSPKE